MTAHSKKVTAKTVTVFFCLKTENVFEIS